MVFTSKYCCHTRWGDLKAGLYRCLLQSATVRIFIVPSLYLMGTSILSFSLCSETFCSHSGISTNFAKVWTNYVLPLFVLIDASTNHGTVQALTENAVLRKANNISTKVTLCRSRGILDHIWKDSQTFSTIPIRCKNGAINNLPH